MGKLQISLLSLLMIFFVVACNSDADFDENGNTPPLPEIPEEEENNDDIDGETILSDTINAMSNVENYVIETNMNYYTSTTNNEKTLENKFRSQTSVNLDPTRYYESSFIIKPESEENGEKESIHLQRYFTEDGFFMYDSTKNRWIEFPEEFLEDFRAYDTSYESPSYILELIEQNVTAVHLSEGNEYYLLTFDGIDEETDEIVFYMFQLVDTDLAKSLADMLYVSDIARLDFEIKIDKETLYAQELKMTLRFELLGDEPTEQYSDYVVVIHYDNFNDTEEITIPTTVLEEAEEMEIEEFSGFEEMKELEIMERFDIEELQEEMDENNDTDDDEKENADES